MERSTTRFRTYRDRLRFRGRHAFIEGGVLEILQFLFDRFERGPKVIWGVAPDSPETMVRLCERIEAGALRPSSATASR